MTRRRLRIALGLFSLVLALILAELALNFVVFPRGVFPIGDMGPKELRYTEYDSDLGWRLRPGAVGGERTPEFDIPIRINAQGLRADREYEAAPQSGRRRVAAAGDSFTFGVGVELRDSWPAQVEALLPDLEVVNLGVPGFGTDQQLMDLQRRIADLRPETVVLGLYVGDVPRNIAPHLNGFPKPWFEPDDRGVLVRQGVPVPEVSDAASIERVRGGVLERLRLAEIAIRVLPQLWWQLGYGEAWPRTQAILGDMARVCKEHDARLLVLLIPRLDAVERHGLRRKVHRRGYQRLLEVAAASGVEKIDPLPALDAWVAAHPDRPAYWASDHHFTADGQRVVAEAVVSHLTASGHAPPDQTRR